MNCPVCEGTLPDDAPACDWCTVKLGRDASGRVAPVYPAIQPGDLLSGVDFRVAPLFGESTRVREWKSTSRYDGTPDGVVMSVRADNLYYFGQPYLSMRDGCVRASMVALDPLTTIAVYSRMQWVESATVRYELVVRPSERSFTIRRYTGGGDVTETADITNLLPQTQSDAIAPERYPNVVEMRAQGPTLQAWVNGHLLASVHDATFGFGQLGIVIGTSKAPEPNAPRRVLCQWAEIREVAT